MAIDWKGNSALLATGAISALSWLGFLFTITIWRSESIAFILLLLAIITLVRFGQLLDKHLADVLK